MGHTASYDVDVGDASNRGKPGRGVGGGADVPRRLIVAYFCYHKTVEHWETVLRLISLVLVQTTALISFLYIMSL